MSKILKNTTLLDIELNASGFTIPASGQVTIDEQDYLLLASEDSINELSPLVNAGDIIVNDGNSDLTSPLAINYLKYPDQARNILFDNTSNGFTSNEVQSAIEEAKQSAIQFLQFQIIGTLNYDNYLYSNDNEDRGRRSGDVSSGYRFSSSAPLICSINGIVSEATIALKGAACSTGSPSNFVNLKFELWKVGFNGQGTKLGDIDFFINSTQNVVGKWWNSSVDTNYTNSISTNIAVEKGDLLGLKFIRQTSNDTIVEIKNATVNIKVDG